MTAFDKYLHAILVQGEHEAQKDGSATIEAHHLLLAIADQEGTTAHRLLTSVGLDHRAIRDALDQEFLHSLSAAGVSLTAADLPRPSNYPKRPAHIGASAKSALGRGFASTRKKDLQSAHLLLAILQAQVGTVPRALGLAGIDQGDLTARVQQTLTNESEFGSKHG